MSDEEIIDKILRVYYDHRNDGHDLQDVLNNKIGLIKSATPLEYINIEEKMIRYLLLEVNDKHRTRNYKITNYGKNVQEDGGYIEYNRNKKELERLQRENIQASIDSSKATEKIRRYSNTTKWLVIFQTSLFAGQLIIMCLTYCIETKRRQSDIENQSKPSNAMVTFPANYLQDLKYHLQGIDTVYISNYPNNFNCRKGKNPK